MRSCVICGETKNVGQVITISPYGNYTNRFDVCMKHIKKIEAYLNGEAKIVKKKKAIIINESRGSTLNEFLDYYSDQPKSL